MNEVEFDKALSEFLDDDEYERVSEAVFSLIRSAYAAGWKAAMDSNLKAVQNIFNQ